MRVIQGRSVHSAAVSTESEFKTDGKLNFLTNITQDITHCLSFFSVIKKRKQRQFVQIVGSVQRSKNSNKAAFKSALLLFQFPEAINGNTFLLYPYASKKNLTN